MKNVFCFPITIIEERNATMTRKNKLNERRFKAIKGKMIKKLRGLQCEEDVHEVGDLAAKKSTATTSRDDDIISAEEFFGSVDYE